MLILNVHCLMISDAQGFMDRSLSVDSLFSPGQSYFKEEGKKEKEKKLSVIYKY